MKTCPICKSRTFDDMDVCYGCLHHFNEREKFMGRGFEKDSSRVIDRYDGLGVLGASEVQQAKPSHDIFSDYGYSDGDLVPYEDEIFFNTDIDASIVEGKHTFQYRERKGERCTNSVIDEEMAPVQRGQYAEKAVVSMHGYTIELYMRKA